MRKFILPLFAFAMLIPLSAKADNIIIQRNAQAGDQVTQLPGNATIVTNPNTATGVTITGNNSDSVLYRTLIAPNARNTYYQPNTANLNDVNSICSGEHNVTQQNKCVREVIKEREKLQKRYND